MGANKFATMVHRNTNSMTLILVYALLEWVLIILLLVNALFSYLIVKFSDYFGLKPPCPLCSRIDHFLNPKKGKSFYRDLLCEDHASEISSLTYCLNHRKLTDSLALCQDCSSSSSSSSRWRPENGEVGSEFLCCCCGLRFDFVKEECRIEKGNDSEMGLDDLFKGGNIDGSTGFQHLEYFLGKDGFNLIPIELIDPTTDEEQHHGTVQEAAAEADADLVLFEPELVVYNSSYCFDEKEKDPSAYDESTKLVIVDMNENSIVFNSENYIKEKLNDDDDDDGNQEGMAAASFEEKEFDPSGKDESTLFVIQENENSVVFSYENHDQDKLDDDAATGKEEEKEDESTLTMEIRENENSVVLNSVNFDQDKLDDVAHQAKQDEDDKLDDVYEDVCHQTAMAAAAEGNEEEDEEEEFPHMPINEIEADVSIGTDIPDLVSSSSSSSNSDNFHGEKDHDDDDQYEEETIELKPISVELTEQHFFPIQTEETRNINEPDEEKVPETPTSSDSFLNPAEGVDGITSIDRLKSALRSERKALFDLYTELEEERSASAIAANQTMAMINRLQEEKAAMQMEALQYQRMMEEQSEYDQEALQLLNELMVKREREKQELERELEVYRRKDKTRQLSSSSSSSTTSPDPDETTPVGDVFEGDKIQILEHLKVLEGKLLSLGVDEDKELVTFEENGYHLMGVKGKRLLPLFDAISDENGELNYGQGNENGYGSSSKRIIEVDEIYERVEALEADGEFLKNCIGSLNKGDKGMVVLREILQHLRDLKTAGQTLNNISDGPLL